MWLIHEHCNSTSAIDKYWVFQTKELAISKFHEMLKASKDFLDLDYAEEIWETSYVSETADGIREEEITFDAFKEQYILPDSDSCIHLSEGDYLVLTEIDKDGFGRRP